MDIGYTSLDYKDFEFVTKLQNENSLYYTILDEDVSHKLIGNESIVIEINGKHHRREFETHFTKGPIFTDIDRKASDDLSKLNQMFTTDEDIIDHFLYFHDHPYSASFLIFLRSTLLVKTS